MSGVDGGAATEDQSGEEGQGGVAEQSAAIRATDLGGGVEKGGSRRSRKNETGGGAAAKPGLTMFHVVFLLNPPALESAVRVAEMYDHVVKKFSRALKAEQARSGYVWEQSQLILKLARKAQENSPFPPPKPPITPNPPLPPPQNLPPPI